MPLIDGSGRRWYTNRVAQQREVAACVPEGVELPSSFTRMQVIEDPGMPDDRLRMVDGDGNVVMTVLIPATETTDDSRSPEVK